MKNTTNNALTMSHAPKDILQHHLGSFIENDLEALMNDYTSESVLITPKANYSGLTEIRKFFIDLIAHFPKQKSSVELDATVINEELVYIVWHGKSPSLHIPFATDTFVIKKGKIYRQTFAGQLNPV